MPAAAETTPAASTRQDPGDAAGLGVAQRYLISKPVSAADLAPLLVRVAAA